MSSARKNRGSARKQNVLQGWEESLSSLESSNSEDRSSIVLKTPSPNSSYSSPEANRSIRTSRQTPRQALRETPRQPPHQTPRQTLRQTPRQTLRQTPRQTFRETPRQTFRETPRETPQQNTKSSNNAAKVHRSRRNWQYLSKRKTKAPDKITADILYLRTLTRNMIPRLPFSRLVREIMHEMSDEVHMITLPALEALQQSAELFMTQRFQDSYMLTLHRGRVTLTVKDMELVRFLRLE